MPEELQRIRLKKSIVDSQVTMNKHKQIFYIYVDKLSKLTEPTAYSAPSYKPLILIYERSNRFYVMIKLRLVWTSIVVFVYS